MEKFLFLLTSFTFIYFAFDDGSIAKWCSAGGNKYKIHLGVNLKFCSDNIVGYWVLSSIFDDDNFTALGLILP